MSLKSRLIKSASVAVLLAVLAACDSAEERAEQHYESGMKLVAAGQIDKAMIEFRTVFDLNGEHLPARLEYARLLLEREDYDQAMGQYLRVLEQAPDNRVARLAVARTMLKFQNFIEAEKHSSLLLAADPDDIDGLAIRATTYMRLDRQAEGLAIANQILERDPANVGALLVVVSDHYNNDRTDQAIASVDAAIALVPGEMSFYVAKLAMLEDQQRDADITTLLQAMAEQFPENDAIREAQVGWMVEMGDAVGAERLLREIAARQPDNAEAALNVVALLEGEKGLEAAQAELAELAARPGPLQPEFQRALATMVFRTGGEQEAIDSVRELAAQAGSDEERVEDQVLLAFLLLETGEKAESLALVNSVLETDKSNVPALKIRARIAIADDRYDEAIADLRLAQDADPNDAAVYSLQATAHRLNGNIDLANDRLAMAVSVSGSAPEPALEYAAALSEQGKLEVAEAVVADAAQRNPRNRDLLAALAQVRLDQQNWSGADEVAQQLRQMSDNGQDEMADNIGVAVLMGQNKVEESIGLLRSMMGSGDDIQQQTTMLNIVRAHVEAGETTIAEQFLLQSLVEAPDNYTASLLLAGLYAVTERPGDAEQLYRTVIEKHPTQPGGYEMLARLLSSQEKPDESREIILQGLENSPDTDRLNFLLATEYESNGNFDGAIDIYAALYKANPMSELLANNLASLLSEHRTDPESLAKAIAVSRRLRDSDFPPYQDTYGWILYLKGDYEQALSVLARAEDFLGDNPVFKVHLGLTQSRLGQKEQAIENLTAALAAAGDNVAMQKQMDLARQELESLNKAP